MVYFNNFDDRDDDVDGIDYAYDQDVVVDDDDGGGDDDDDYFNPEYVEVDRVLQKSVTDDPDTGGEMTHFLVKWRGLPYEDATWELEQDVDKDKIDFWEKMSIPPEEEEREELARPGASEWEQLDESPVYKNDNTLREYQLEGINWLTYCWLNR